VFQMLKKLEALLPKVFRPIIAIILLFYYYFIIVPYNWTKGPSIILASEYLVAVG
jgi:hypothetical protein